MLHVAIHYHLTTEDSNTTKDILCADSISGCPTEACALEYYKEARSGMSIQFKKPGIKQFKSQSSYTTRQCGRQGNGVECVRFKVGHITRYLTACR